MTAADYIVLVGYFMVVLGIGWWAARRIRNQEDYFLGGRRFGKWMQAFAAFGAGTGAADPVNTARTSFTSGMSGMWSVMSWLFATPFYWITGVWYRRMRHITLGDWFVERFESKRLGAAYTLFGLLFYMVYTSMMFSAIGKVAAPLMGDTLSFVGRQIPLEYVLVPVIGCIVVIYGVLGGVTAAYWTDLLQGIFIIALSIVLIPFGLEALVERFGDPSTDGLLAGFRIMHEQVPESMFKIVGAPNSSEFPIHRIASVAIISLLGVAVQPHFIATGGGTAKSEFHARVGLVAGNFAKRFCTIGWALTALIVLALYADNLELMADPDKAWGVASRELLAPGLRGLMLACLLAALMSSVDCYMIVSSALVVRNVYVPFVNPSAGDRECLRVGRLAGVVIIVGAIGFSWSMMDVFGQLQLTWVIPMLFAAPFWIGMLWRRATTAGAWITMGFVGGVFFVLPWLIPTAFPQLRTHAAFTTTNYIVTKTFERPASPTDVRKRQASIDLWESRSRQGEQQVSAPEPITEGDSIRIETKTGGTSIFWSGGVEMDASSALELVSRTESGGIETTVEKYVGPLKGKGAFRIDFLVYRLLGIDLETKSSPILASMELPLKIVVPFAVMILASLLTRRNSKAALDRFYIKMATPVEESPDKDREGLQAAFASPNRLASKKLFPRSEWEINRPTKVDIVGFVLSFAICFMVIGMAAWLAGIGSATG